MDDLDVLNMGMQFCDKHYSKYDGCYNCPLCGNVCIDYHGVITFSNGDTKMTFRKFTEQFRKMINIIGETT